ncbi:MAG: acetamidase/formamidase family protein [Chloroflexi bacterium]|nr:acetamidase/formamidase family protein [Chloroflexota bacterium]
MTPNTDAGNDRRRAEEAVRAATAAYLEARDALEAAELDLRLGLVGSGHLQPAQERVEAAYAALQAAAEARDQVIARLVPAGGAGDAGGTAAGSEAGTPGGETGARDHPASVPLIRRDRLGYVIGPDVAPALVVDPGATVALETEDALSGRIRTARDQQSERLARFHAERDAGVIGPNPVTGPIFVRGAEPGDTLVVRIDHIDLDDQGVTRFRKALSPLGDLFAADRIKIVRVADGLVHWSERLRFPARPMVGVIGTAPALEALSSGRPGSHGGNMDCPEIAPGATVYLPVAVPGGLLFVGDCHAAMGDAEIGNTAIEARATVTLTVGLQKGRPAGFHWPRVETPEAIVVVAAGNPLDRTLQAAFRDLILWMEADYGWDRAEAYLLATQVADGRIGNSETIRAVMPKRYLIDRLPP